ncbi:transglycosylase domain-containing protein [Heliorestis convoluta]|nr:PBP1A family penicillin-binding protein [Heliorestis convoluta]
MKEKKEAESFWNEVLQPKLKGYVRPFLIPLLVLFLFLFLPPLLVLAYYLQDRPAFDADSLLSMQATSFIYDKDGELITALHGEQNRIPVSIEEVPENLQKAILVAEDLRFHNHQGIDLRAILRAFFTNVQDGGFSQGASTITQQLAKNAILSPEKTIQRKIHEAFLAYQIERRYTKDEILEMYLNWIYFGHGAYGVQAAAQTYFNKDIRDINLAEAALLAGMPRRPSFYSPIHNAEAASDRRSTVLHLMIQNGLITQEEARMAASEPLPQQVHINSLQYPFPAYVDYVIEELTSRHGYTDSQVFRGGLHIYTAMDRRLQQKIEEVLSSEAFFPPNSSDQLVQAAMAVIEQESGLIRGLGGGRNYDGVRSFNRASQLKRQPGSAAKPIFVFAPAMEAGFHPNDILPDSPINFGGGYVPRNYDNTYRGHVTIRQAVAQSINVPAVYLFRHIGPTVGVDFARKTGLPMEGEEPYLSLALGGMTRGVSPLQMAGSYASMANGGIYNEPHAVTRIVDFQGREKPIVPDINRVLSEVAAYQMTDMLVTAVQSGTGTRAQMNRPVAGKTGTVELPPIAEFRNLRGNKDAWFVGYTPELTCAVWMGYDRTDRHNYLRQIYGGSYPAAMFREVLNSALQDRPVQAFARPAEVLHAAGDFIGRSASASTIPSDGASTASAENDSNSSTASTDSTASSSSSSDSYYPSSTSRYSNSSSTPPANGSTSSPTNKAPSSIDNSTSLSNEEAKKLAELWNNVPAVPDLGNDSGSPTKSSTSPPSTSKPTEPAPTTKAPTPSDFLNNTSNVEKKGTEGGLED